MFIKPLTSLKIFQKLFSQCSEKWQQQDTIFALVVCFFRRTQNFQFIQSYRTRCPGSQDIFSMATVVVLAAPSASLWLINIAICGWPTRRESVGQQGMGPSSPRDSVRRWKLLNLWAKFHLMINESLSRVSKTESGLKVAKRNKWPTA